LPSIECLKDNPLAMFQAVPLLHVIRRPLYRVAFTIGLVALLGACTPASSVLTSNNGTSLPILAGSKYTPGAPIKACGGTVFPPPDQWLPAGAVGCLPTRTPVAPTGPMFAYNSQQLMLDILNALPKQIQNQTMNLVLETDPTHTYIGKDNRSGTVVGIAARYSLNGDNTSELFVSLFITPSENDSEDRFLLQYHKMNDIYGFPTVPSELGDESYIAPEVKPAKQDIGLINAPVWGSFRLRNVEVDLYPTKNLTDQLPGFSAADAIYIQKAILAALSR